MKGQENTLLGDETEEVKQKVYESIESELNDLTQELIYMKSVKWQRVIMFQELNAKGKKNDHEEDRVNEKWKNAVVKKVSCRGLAMHPKNAIIIPILTNDGIFKWSRHTI